MYKYKETADVEVGDLVVWTDISKYHDTLTKDKVYQVTNHPDQNTLNVINDKGNKNSYGKGFGFKVLQTKSASEAVVGDYMYRVSSGNTKFPQYSIMKITKIDAKSNISNLYYTSTSSVSFIKVIVIAQAEPSLVHQAPTIPERAIERCFFPTPGAPSEPSQPTIKEQPMNKTTL